MENVSAVNDLDQINAVASASVAHEFEVKLPNGASYPLGGIWISVIGRQADPVNQHYAKVVNEHFQRTSYAKRRGKDAEPKTVEQIQKESIEGAAVRVVGWRGVKQPFDIELIRRVLRNNPHWIDQIIEESDELGNFI